MDLLTNLNPEQLSAVKHKDGPLLIVAGAGTGKTTVITRRLAFLIDQGLAKPEEILALTFTEKAAGEMAERVDELLPYGYFDLWISTFHGFGQRILKDHGLEIGLPADFRLLNEFEQWALIKKNLDKFELDYYRPLGNPTKFVRALIKHFSRAKDEDISPAAYLEYAEELKQNLDGMLSGSSVIPAQAGIQKIGEGQKQKSLDPRLRGDDKKDGGGADREIIKQEITRINEVANAYHVYQQLLLDGNALDFGDLINYSLKLFRERPAILEKYRRQFKYILLDEFQDTNWSQYELVKILAAPKHNLTVVGDDDQSIFRFRGASMSNILQFSQDYPQTKKIILIKNYRSRQNILDLAYEFIKQNNPNRLEWQLNKKIPNSKSQIPNKSQIINSKLSVIPAPEPESSLERFGQVSGLPAYRTGRRVPGSEPGAGSARDDKQRGQILNKKLIAENQGLGEIAVIQGADLAEEVKLAVDKIVELKNSAPPSNGGRGRLTWNDFAILIRANDSAGDFMAELDRRGLPFIFGASRGLYLKPVIMDAISYFKLLDNYHESAALWRVLNLPIYKFSQEELIKLNHLAHKKACSLYEALKQAEVLKLSAEFQEKAKPILSLVARHAALASRRGASEILLAFMNESGYLKYLTKQADSASSPQAEEKGRADLAWLNQFLKRVQAFESSADDKTVKAFLAELNLEMEAGEAGGLAADLEAGPEAIKILTAHGAKGLEFQYVILANLVDKRFPTIERSEPINLPEALIKEILPQGETHLEEERRLFYVAMTRARLGLYFSLARDYGGLREKKPSRFLVELGLVNKSQIPNPKSQTNPKSQILNSKKIQPKIPLTPNARGGKTEIPPDVRRGEVPSHFSYSQLAAYSNCPYQYRFAHVLKIPVMGKEQFSFGKTMHATLQKLFILLNERKGLKQAGLFEAATSPTSPYPSPSKGEGTPGEGNIIPLLTKEGLGEVITLDEILNLYEQSWVDDWYESKWKKQQRKKQGREILKVFYEKHKDGWPEVLFLEKGFNLKIFAPTSADLPARSPARQAGEADWVKTKLKKTGGESYAMRGVIDRIDGVKPGDRPADCRSDRKEEFFQRENNKDKGFLAPPPASGSVRNDKKGVVGQPAAGLKLVDYKTGRPKKAKDLNFEDKEQLFIYQLAAGELFKEPVCSLAFYYLEDNSEVEFIGRPGDLEKIKDKIISAIEKIRQGEFPPRPGRICAWCDFNGICEYRYLGKD